MNKYYLSHITTEECAEMIMNDNFMKSVHDVQRHSNMWLGDGIYFWDANCETSEKSGIKLVKHKFKEEVIVKKNKYFFRS